MSYTEDELREQLLQAEDLSSRTSPSRRGSN